MIAPNVTDEIREFYYSTGDLKEKQLAAVAAWAKVGGMTAFGDQGYRREEVTEHAVRPVVIGGICLHGPDIVGEDIYEEMAVTSVGTTYAVARPEACWAVGTPNLQGKVASGGAYMVGISGGGTVVPTMVAFDSSGDEAPDETALHLRGPLLLNLQTTADTANVEAGMIAWNETTGNAMVHDGSEWSDLVSKIKQRLCWAKGQAEDSLMFNEYLGNTVRTDHVSVVGVGAGSGIVPAGALDKTDHPGVWLAATGTATTGRTFVISSATNGWHIGVGGVTSFGAWVMTPGNLSDAINPYTTRTGFFSITLPNTILEGIGFEYTHDQNGGRWQGITDATGESSLDTGITFAVNTWYFLEFVINATGTSVEFFINTDTVGTLSTAANIPQGTGFNLFYNHHIMKLGAGATSEYFGVDADFVVQEVNR